MKTIHILMIASSMVLVSACASSNVVGINTFAQNQIHDVNISEVDVALEVPIPNPLLLSALQRNLEIAMRTCATGTWDHRMKVTITDFEGQNVAQAILIGDEIELSGRVELIDLESNSQTGEYFIQTSFFWGGFLGAAIMSEAEENLSQEFAETLCEEVFGLDLAQSATVGGVRQ